MQTEMLTKETEITDFSRKRPRLQDMDLPLGKRTRLRRMFHEHGPGGGTGLFLPIDQGLEHGPVDFFANPDATNPLYQLELARRGNFSAIVFQPGIARKYMRDYAGSIPLVMKLNGKTSIPPDDRAFGPLTGTVEEAVAAGADAVGYTLYVGSPAQPQDFMQFVSVKTAADRFGMPVIVWAYPRGEAIEKKGGRDSLYAVDYAARVAAELGADVVKLNLPKFDPERAAEMPKPYNELALSPQDAMAKVCASAGNIPVLVSGGGKMNDDELLQKAEECMAAGCSGLIFGRNMWQRRMHDALAMSGKLSDILRRYAE
ncbi:MAG TPA: fructose-bisphosphate aldolase [Planctomycetota bacterium]|nr:fructose-bisphosphate aldolase [Planctomycetota bacterium]